MKYEYDNKQVTIATEKEKDIFFKSFFRTVSKISKGAKVYYENMGECTLEDIAHDCALVIMSDKDGYVYCAEVWCENGLFYGRASIALYDYDALTRYEVAEIANFIDKYWGRAEEEKDDIVLRLARKKPLTDEQVMMLSGSIYHNALDVQTDGHIYPNLLPRMIEWFLGDMDGRGCVVNFEVVFS